MSDRPAIRLVEAIRATPWAMTEEWCRQLEEIASREHDVSPEALEAYRARRVAGTDNLTERNGVAIVSARGPMFRYADFFTSISGGTTYEGLMTDLHAAANMPNARAIILNVDSPGGEVNGVAELANSIRGITSRKPVIAYVGGQGASAAYWLACACSEIVMGPTASVGSIGVVAAIRDTSERDKRSGVVTTEFVSSQSPDKRPDLGTSEGRAKIQKVVDRLAAEFIQAVAGFRGVTADHVTKEFGRGSVEVGSDAIDRGMADRIGSFEEVLAQLSAGYTPSRKAPKPKGQDMTDKTFSQADLDAAVAAAVGRATAEATATAAAAATETATAAAMKRAGEIMALEEAKGREEQARHLAFHTALTVDQAKAVLAAGPKVEAPKPASQPAPAQGKRSSDAPGGLLPAEGGTGAAAPVSIDRNKLYDKFSGKSAA